MTKSLETNTLVRCIVEIISMAKTLRNKRKLYDKLMGVRWYAGITNDINRRINEHSLAGKLIDKDCGRYFQLPNSDIAQLVEKILGILGFDGAEEGSKGAAKTSNIIYFFPYTKI